jgi:hypothetical protein
MDRRRIKWGFVDAILDDIMASNNLILFQILLQPHN